jgi:hypothetical protein
VQAVKITCTLAVGDSIGVYKKGKTAMSIVRIPTKHFIKVTSELAKFPLCQKRFQSLQVEWVDCVVEASWTEPEQPGKESDIPEITYGDDLPTTSMEYEVAELGNSNMSDSDECLFELLQALARYNPKLSGRSTPSLGSSNDYQRNRD